MYLVNPIYNNKIHFLSSLLLKNKKHVTRCTSSNNFLSKESDQFKYLFLLKAEKCGLKLFLGELLEILNELESHSALEQLKLWYNIQPIHYENTPTGFSSFRSKNTSPPTQNDQLLNEYFVIKAYASESGLSPENDQNI
uniref:Uncharacterized protein n=1 Tax=Rhizophagus irregularis (strain DAOM 181602 / DAOM 197198 / MUCL 43194) TaxID=747089 RepID=U9UW01_RHIID